MFFKALCSLCKFGKYCSILSKFVEHIMQFTLWRRLSIFLHGDTFRDIDFEVWLFLVYPANNARLRLLRLSEAAEKLQRQAVVNVQTGKENDARELLFQKKKIMQALENSKSRIELLDELSTKLNEVDLTKIGLIHYPIL